MVLFFDIDGTLIDTHHQLPPSLLPAMKSAKRHGHQLIINTGRTLCNLDNRLKAYPFDGWITGCGSHIVYHEEILRNMYFSLPESLMIRSLFRELNLPAVYECDTGIYFDPLIGQNDPAIQAFSVFAQKAGIYREVTENDRDFCVIKMFCFSDSLPQIHLFQTRSLKMGFSFETIHREDSGNGWEIVPSCISKATGMEIICDRLGVSIDHTFAFGDSENDLPMLNRAGVSIAMGNAPQHVKSACTYVTDYPEDDGIVKAMKNFHLI